MAIHIGNGKDALSKIFQVLENSEIPIRHFLPTHLNRRVLEDAIKFGKLGGCIDFTTKIEEFPASNALIQALESAFLLNR